MFVIGKSSYVLIVLIVFTCYEFANGISFHRGDKILSENEKRGSTPESKNEASGSKEPFSKSKTEKRGLPPGGPDGRHYINGGLEPPEYAGYEPTRNSGNGGYAHIVIEHISDDISISKILRSEEASSMFSETSATSSSQQPTQEKSKNRRPPFYEYDGGYQHSGGGFIGDRPSGYGPSYGPTYLPPPKPVYYDGYEEGHQYPEQHGSGQDHGIGVFKALTVKKILLPLAGLAILGVAAAAASHNPILLQLGTVKGRRKRALSLSDVYPPSPIVKPIKAE